MRYSRPAGDVARVRGLDGVDVGVGVDPDDACVGVRAGMRVRDER